MKIQILKHTQVSEKNKIEMIDFYNEATEDYEFWSRDFNMHFGYFVPFQTNPFKRDSMLNQMNMQVLNKLDLNTQKSRLIDLGCGMGGTMRYALKYQENLTTYGVTLSGFQVQHGNVLLQNSNGIILEENYNETSFQANTFDAAVAIESFCHSGHDASSIQEAARILKPGGRLVIADAFLKKDRTQLCNGARYAYEQLCNHWSLEKLETIANIEYILENNGFTDIRIQDASFKVAPSVLHVPFAIIGYTLKKLLRFKAIKRESFHNLKGSFYALLAGLHFSSFGYFIIKATKRIDS